MNSYRQGLRNGVLVNLKLFILEKVNFGPHAKCWSNLVKLGQTCHKLVLFGAGHYNQAILFDLQSSAGRISSSQGLKFIALTRATHGYKKERISPKIQMSRFREIKIFRISRCS